MNDSEDYKVMSKWLSSYDNRERQSSSLWVVGVSSLLIVLCVFAGFSAVQFAIVRSFPQTGAAPANNYSVAHALESVIQGVKYQFGIALAFQVRLWSLTVYRCIVNSEPKKWLFIFITEGSLIVALVTFAFYSYASYHAFASQVVCAGCFPPTTFGLLGASQLWGGLLTFVIFVETIHGVARLALPTIDAIRDKVAD